MENQTALAFSSDGFCAWAISPPGASGEDALHDNLLVFAYPTKDIPAEFLVSLEKYVNDGGKILVIDSAENRKLHRQQPVGPLPYFTAKRERALAGDLEFETVTRDPTDNRPIDGPAANPHHQRRLAATDDATDPAIFAKVTDKPVYTTVHHGKGTVTVVGFGSRFVDLNMGFTGDNEPDRTLRAVYQVEFDLLHNVIEGH